MMSNDQEKSAVHRMEFGHIDFDGARIAYAERRGPAEPGSAPLVFLHGGALDHRMWSAQLGAFSDRRALSVDARGHGWTTAPDGADFRHADDVVAVLDGLGIERAVLVGLSMGASTAVDVALEHPGRVAGVVACGAGTSDPDFRDPWVLSIFGEWQSAAEAADPEAWIAAALKFVAGPHRRVSEVDDAVVGEVEAMVRHTLFTHIMRPEGPVMPTQATPVDGPRRRLGEIRVPLLGIEGSLDADDHIRMVAELVSEVSSGELVTLEGAAHYPNLEQPEAFNRAVAAFLRTSEE